MRPPCWTTYCVVASDGSWTNATGDDRLWTKRSARSGASCAHAYTACSETAAARPTSRRLWSLGRKARLSLDPALRDRVERQPARPRERRLRADERVGLAVVRDLDRAGRAARDGAARVDRDDAVRRDRERLRADDGAGAGPPCERRVHDDLGRVADERERRVVAADEPPV